MLILEYLSTKHDLNSTTTEYDYDDGEDGFLSNTNQTLTPERRKELLRTCTLPVLRIPFAYILLAERKLDEVSRWLIAWNSTEKHKHMLQIRQEGTCTWFPKIDIYKEWRVGGSRNQFLWLHGIGVVSDTFRVAEAHIAHPSCVIV